MTFIIGFPTPDKCKRFGVQLLRDFAREGGYDLSGFSDEDLLQEMSTVKLDYSVFRGRDINSGYRIFLANVMLQISSPNRPS